MRSARCNPKLSAYTYLEGVHDFNKVPLAPPCTKVIVHRPPDTRSSWAYYGEQGWCIGPAMNHYRCYHYFLPRFGRKILHILQTHHAQLPITENNQHELQQAFSYLAKILHNYSVPKCTLSLAKTAHFPVHMTFLHPQQQLSQDQGSYIAAHPRVQNQRTLIVHHSATQRVKLPPINSIPNSSLLPKK